MLRFVAAKEEAAQPRVRAVKHSDGKSEAKNREEKAEKEEAERSLAKRAKNNDDASVASAKDRSVLAPFLLHVCSSLIHLSSTFTGQCARHPLHDSFSRDVL